MINSEIIQLINLLKLCACAEAGVIFELPVKDVI